MLTVRVRTTEWMHYTALGLGRTVRDDIRKSKWTRYLEIGLSDIPVGQIVKKTALEYVDRVYLFEDSDLWHNVTNTMTESDFWSSLATTAY